MGFDVVKELKILSEKDLNLLEEICIKYNVSSEEVENLLIAEELYQFMERRHGIYENLKRILEADEK
jgi:hypothetical protein